MINYARFENRARAIDHRLRNETPRVGDALHESITSFCDRWYPINTSGRASEERFLAYQVLWEWELERLERALNLEPGTEAPSA